MSMIGILYSLEQLHVMWAYCLQMTLQSKSLQSEIIYNLKYQVVYPALM